MRIIALGVILLMFTACQANLEAGSAMICPTWTRYDGNCEVAVAPVLIATSKVDFDLRDWDQVRLIILNGNVVFEAYHNIKVSSEGGVEIDHEKSRFYQGVYLVKKVNFEDTAKFTLINPVSGSTVNVDVEKVRLVKDKVQ